MNADEAIKIHRGYLSKQKAFSQELMRSYQTGEITKAAHNIAQTEINRTMIAQRLGIEALEAFQQARREGRQISAKELLPSETE